MISVTAVIQYENWQYLLVTMSYVLLTLVWVFVCIQNERTGYTSVRGKGQQGCLFSYPTAQIPRTPLTEGWKALSWILSSQIPGMREDLPLMKVSFWSPEGFPWSASSLGVDGKTEQRSPAKARPWLWARARQPGFRFQQRCFTTVRPRLVNSPEPLSPSARTYLTVLRWMNEVMSRKVMVNNC